MGSFLSEPWKNILEFPLKNRNIKPRKDGLTMVIDKGLGLYQVNDLLKVNGAYVDYLKLGFGTAALYPRHVLEEKISLIKEHGIKIYTGGTFFEVAFLQNKVTEYLHTLINLGFRTVEISDGTIELPIYMRTEYIRQAVSLGLEVITEVGKKDSSVVLDWDDCLSDIEGDLKAGASKVIIEGRESGKGVGMYDESGAINSEPFEKIKNNLDIRNIIFEAPLKDQQHELIEHIGVNVNLGNINPNEVLALEALRVGLRGDTLNLTINNSK